MGLPQEFSRINWITVNERLSDTQKTTVFLALASRLQAFIFIQSTGELSRRDR